MIYLTVKAKRKDNEKKCVYCYTFIFLKRCHEQFEMPYGPDIVTFSKKMLSGGIYHNREHRPAQPGRVQNTWIGDAHKIIMLEQVHI